MGARTNRSPFYVAGAAAVLAAGLAGCAAASSSAGSAGSGTSTAASSSPLDAVQLAAKTTSGASSFTGTMSVKSTAKSGASGSDDVSLTATMAEQVRPSVEAEVQIGSLAAAGTTMPGSMTEIVTPSNFYLKWAFLTQELHTTKPWLVLPVSAMSKSTGIDLSQLMSQATSSSPLSMSQMLAGASGVRKVGTGTVGGVPVTEYTGTFSITKGMQYLSASNRSAMQKQVTAAGLSTAAFTVWVDGQRVMRKAIITENGADLTEVTMVTITSINQPVNIAVPAASETTPLPTADLGSSS